MKDFVRMKGSLRVLNPKSHPMLIELNKLFIEESGKTSDGMRYVSLSGGPVFYSFADSACGSTTCTYSYLHKYLREDLQGRLPVDYLDIASDIVCRYKYPHADPSIDLPYSYRDRGTFHPQHRDTIQDITNIPETDRDELRSQFQIAEGDVVLDIGSYIGFGALRLSEMVGDNGQVVSVEADTRNQEMFSRNIFENNISNVELVPKAIWSKCGYEPLFWNDSQLNSLVGGIVAEDKSRLTETVSVDSIVEDLELRKVSLVSLTVNGAEIEAIHGMEKTLRDLRPRLSIAGWYERSGQPIYQEVTNLLEANGYETRVGRLGRVYGWAKREA